MAASINGITSSEGHALRHKTTEVVQQASELCQQLSVEAAAAASAGDAASAEDCLTTLAMGLARLANQAAQQAAALSRQAQAAAAAAPDAEAGLKQDSTCAAAAESDVPELQQALSARETAPQLTGAAPCQASAALAAAEVEEAGGAHGDMNIPGASPRTPHLQNTTAVAEAQCPAAVLPQHISVSMQFPADGVHSLGEGELHAAAEDTMKSAQRSTDASATASQAAANGSEIEETASSAAPATALRAATARAEDKSATSTEPASAMPAGNGPSEGAHAPAAMPLPDAFKALRMGHE